MSFCCRIAEGFLTGKPGMTGENNASVTGSRSRPRGSTCSILAVHHANITVLGRTLDSNDYRHGDCQA